MKEADYSFLPKGDQRLRAFVAEIMASAEWDGDIVVQNMEKVFQWIRHGTVPMIAHKPFQRPGGFRSND